MRPVGGGSGSVPGVTGIVVRTISAAEHLGFIDSLPSASFLQTPAWGAVKTEWRQESIGWFEGPRLVGVGLVLYRQLPRLRRFLAYLPEGPLLDWVGPGLDAALTAMTAHLTGAGAFGVRMGPPVKVRAWHAETVKKAIADAATSRLADVPADRTFPAGTAVEAALSRAGWRRQRADDGFGTGQPSFVFQLPLAGRTGEEVLAGMNQLWRRNIKKATKAGVVVTQGGAGDLADFHRLYSETARRDGFNPRPLGYFEQMFAALRSEDPDRIRLYLARHEDDLVAATTWVRVGTHTWYSYGASSTTKREVRGSNAIQWQMVTDAIDVKADVYDLRGITDTVDAGDPHIGLVQFKVGTGGEVVEYLGEWDLPLNRLLYKAFDLYMSRRSRA
jgi:lipid II:glycine glycyltransferase (peptidoglycan interpeptide bridge formation enzyme)